MGVDPMSDWPPPPFRRDRNHLLVELNSEKIVDIQLFKTPMKDRPLEGYIGLQDHGEPNNLFFRNIKIKRL